LPREYGDSLVYDGDKPISAILEPIFSDYGFGKRSAGSMHEFYRDTHMVCYISNSLFITSNIIELFIASIIFA
jgi:hypothetical protein